MAANGAINGQAGGTYKFDPNFTKSVIDATGPKASPRLKKVFGSLVQHLHDFCRENEITMDEFLTTIDLVSWCLCEQPEIEQCGTFVSEPYLFSVMWLNSPIAVFAPVVSIADKNVDQCSRPNV